MDVEKMNEKVGKTTTQASKFKGEKASQLSAKNGSREKSKERSTHPSARGAASHQELGVRDWAAQKSKHSAVGIKQSATGSTCTTCGVSLQSTAGALRKRNVAGLGRGTNQKLLCAHCIEGGDGVDSSTKGERDGVSKDDIVSHLRRLTEEHGKLQSEYARVRILLQDACMKLTNKDLDQQLPIASSEVTRLGGDLESDSSGDKKHEPAPVTELEKLTVEDGNDDCGESSNVSKDRFRSEVLRLKESLLASEQQISTLTQALTACKEEVSQERIIHEELKQEICARDALIEQLHQQVDMLKHQICEKSSELNRKIVELQDKLSHVSRTLKATEKDLKETKEFMQDENNSLAEAMREMEEKANCCALEVERLNFSLQTKEKHCRALCQVSEQMQTQLQLLQSKLATTQDSARNLLLIQGAELSECSVAIRGLYVVAEEIIEHILNSAEVFGVDLYPVLDERSKNRRSWEGRRLVQAILKAAREGEAVDNDGVDLENDAPDTQITADSCGLPSPTRERAEESAVCLTAQVKDVESNLRTIRRMQETVHYFFIRLLNDSDNTKTKLERELQEEKRKTEELSTTAEESRKQRWMLEERNKELSTDLSNAKAGLRDARESLQTMWNRIDERVSWVIENKKMKEELDTTRKQCSDLAAKNGFLEGEIKELFSHIKDGNQENATNKLEMSCQLEKQLALRRQVMDLQTTLVDKDEEFHERCRKYERHQTIVEGNLRKAEQEVQKLDSVIDGILEILKVAPDLHDHPILRRLWEDLDGQSYVENSV